MANPEHKDVDELAAMLNLSADSNYEVRIVSEGQASIIEIKPSRGKYVIFHDDILNIVELVKQHKKFIMYILADSFEPVIKIHRAGLIR